MPRDGQGKYPPLMDEEIETRLAVSKETRVYGSKSDRASAFRRVNDEQLTKVLAVSLTGLKCVADDRSKISLSDTETVKEYTIHYWELCTNNAVIPTWTDIVSAMGYTVAGAYWFMEHNPEHQTTEWLRFLRDAINSAVSKSAMTGALAPIPSLHYLNSQGMRDGVDDMPKGTGGSQQMDADAIVEKYGDLPDD